MLDYSFQFFAGGAVITNPPLNQNKTEGDLVNFSCEGEVTQTYQVKFSEICQLMRTSWKCVKRERFCEDVLRANETQGTPGNLTISWYRDNIPIRSVSSMQVNFQEKLKRKTNQIKWKWQWKWLILTLNQKPFCVLQRLVQPNSNVQLRFVWTLDFSIFNSCH